MSMTLLTLTGIKTMTSITEQPVTIRGKEYPNHGAAARALGVKEATITTNRRYRTLDSVGKTNLAPKVTAKNYDGTTDAEDILENIMRRQNWASDIRDVLKLRLETIVKKYGAK